MMITYLCMPYDKKNVIKRERRKIVDHLYLLSIASCNHKIYSRHEDVFFYINITKNYQRNLIEDMKKRVNHDGD
jgi:transcriptional regulator of NAD metabolism